MFSSLFEMIKWVFKFIVLVVLSYSFYKVIHYVFFSQDDVMNFIAYAIWVIVHIMFWFFGANKFYNQYKGLEPEYGTNSYGDNYKMEFLKGNFLNTITIIVILTIIVWAHFETQWIFN